MNWAESGQADFGSAHAQSGLSGYDPIAVILSKTHFVTASRPITVNQWPVRDA